MFGEHYFGKRYFGNRYWGPAKPPEPRSGGGGGQAMMRADKDKNLRKRDVEIAAAIWLALHQ